MEKTIQGEIYVVVCLANGKKYVGQTRRGAQNRWKEHQKISSRTQSIFGRSIAKYGGSNFAVEVLDYGGDQEELDEKERFWINTLHTRVPDGYNFRDGGNHMTLESLARMKSPRGPRPQSIRDKISQSHKGKKMPREGVEKSRATQRGRKVPPEVIEKIRMANTGRKHTPETKEKIRNANKGVKKTPEHNEKNRLSHLNPSEEKIQKCRQAALEQWEQRRAKGLKGKCGSENHPK